MPAAGGDCHHVMRKRRDPAICTSCTLFALRAIARSATFGEPPADTSPISA
jgi:hypothetical protein